ncbi:MAG: GNAT family N-acetyltransferase [Acidobacteriota bacterium]|nr:GNAT family N-acetyltransferase [Acidobacteriota bacterium]MDH3529319.1 GNAT family N-acetyltransferase [Acidobacteriota bacterium]
MSINKISTRLATNADGERVRELVFGILDEYGLQPDIDGIDRDLFDIEKHYIGRGGVFEVLEDENGVIVGSVGLSPVDEDSIELRKMYFDPSIRGHGLGKKTLSRMIATAEALGFKKIVLETASPLIEAIGLYKSFGFQSVSAAHTPRCDQAFALNLPAGPQNP